MYIDYWLGLIQTGRTVPYVCAGQRVPAREYTSVPFFHIQVVPLMSIGTHSCKDKLTLSVFRDPNAPACTQTDVILGPSSCVYVATVSQ